ncbi:hypothetical protein [Cerasicoccus frondis]|uniref:hypothetical protein n=1 Tax=Cerasicoccus frondis TaxID=490090 RepID=UPI0028528749|nr:hypothetical protein [Cerasicoccus frondis]
MKSALTTLSDQRKATCVFRENPLVFSVATHWLVVSEPLGVLCWKTLVGCVAKHWGISAENTSGFCQFAPVDSGSLPQWVLTENTGGFVEKVEPGVPTGLAIASRENL